MDLLLWLEGDILSCQAYYPREYEDMVRSGLIDDQLVERAMKEAETWFVNPAAFHFDALITVAGRK